MKAELDQSGAQMALVSRSGLALQRLDQRYSHAGVSLKASDNTPWSVRQLYYACDEQRPRLFDQGMSGFVMGANDPDEGYLSIVLLPRCGRRADRARRARRPRRRSSCSATPTAPMPTPSAPATRTATSGWPS